MTKRPPSRFSLDRRTFLRGSGRVFVALPVLEAMLDVNGENLAHGAPLPTYYSVWGCGVASHPDVYGLNTPLKRYHFMPYTQLPVAEEDFSDESPAALAVTYGKNYPLPIAFNNLFALRDEFTLFTGLKIGQQGVDSGLALRNPEFHFYSMMPLLQGLSASTGPSADWAVAQALGADTKFKHLAYQTQAKWYLNEAEPMKRNKWSSGTNGEEIIPEASPLLAYQRLFGGFVPPGGAEEEAFRRRIAMRLSVIDAIKESRIALLQKVGRADKVKLEEHFDAIAQLGQQVSNLQTSQSEVCFQLPPFGPDPALGVDSSPSATGSGSGSGETQRGNLFVDLLHMAFSCDLARGASMCLTFHQSHMPGRVIDPTDPKLAMSIHDSGHAGNTPITSHAKIFRWHAAFLERFMTNCAATNVGGTKLLDRVVCFMTAEGGFGKDENGQRRGGTHSTENMWCILAGGRGLGLKHGRHLNGTGYHPGHVIVTALDAVGLRNGGTYARHGVFRSDQHKIDALFQDT